MDNKEKRLKLNIQQFAEEEVKDKNSNSKEEAEVMTLDEILEDKLYKAEFDRRLTKAQETAIANAKKQWDKEQAEKVAESKKLADMDEIQKRDYEIDNLKKELSKRDQEKQADDLRMEAIKQASEKGIPVEVMSELDYKNETAESINKKIEVYSRAFQSVKTTAIENYSKESAPQTGENIQPEDNKTGYEKFAEKFNK